MAGEKKNEGNALEDNVFGKSVFEERPHLGKRLTVNGAMTEGVEENIINLCLKE